MFFFSISFQAHLQKSRPSTGIKAFKAIYAAIAANPNAEKELTPETVSKLARITTEWLTINADTRDSLKDELKSNNQVWQTRLSDYIAAQINAEEEAKNAKEVK